MKIYKINNENIWPYKNIFRLLKYFHIYFLFLFFYYEMNESKQTNEYLSYIYNLEDTIYILSVKMMPGINLSRQNIIDNNI